MAAGAVPPGSGPQDRGRLPEISWSTGQGLWGLLVGLALGAIVAPLLVLPFDPGLDSDGGLLAAQALLGGAFLVVSIRIALRTGGGSLGAALHRLGLLRFRAKDLLWVPLALLLYYMAAGVFAQLVVEPDQEDIAGELGVGDENILVAAAAVALICVLAPISEELFFRGLVFAGLRNRFGPWPAALLGGLAFGAIHAPTGITTVIPLAALGVVFCWLYERTGSLWPPVIAHAINNSLALAIIS